MDVPLRVPEGGIPESALAFKPEIAALDADIVVTKRQWSAFYGTELDLQLRRRNIDTLIVGGVMTNFGVESTARDDGRTITPYSLPRTRAPVWDGGMHAFAIEKILPRVARVRQLEYFLESMR